MYRFLLRPKWIGFHLLVVGAIVAMINLGLWQLRRLQERQDFNAAVTARYDADPVPIDELLGGEPGPEQLAELEWRPVTVTGTYEPEGTVHIVNRSQNGRAGDNIVVPLRLSDGRVVLVNRGFVPLGVDVPPAADAELTVAGRLRSSQEHRFGQLTDPAEGVLTEAQRVDLDRLADQVDGELLPMYVDRYDSDPPEPPVVEPVAKPDLSEGSHRSYAFQWFIFSVCVAVGWVLAVRRSVMTRRREAAGASSAVPADEPIEEPAGRGA